MTPDDERAPDEGLRTSVRTVWQQALRKPVGDDHDFFDLGGDSLAAVSICTGLEERFHLRPRLRMIFDQPVFDDYVHEFSKILQEARP